MTDPIGFTREDLDRWIEAGFGNPGWLAALRHLRSLLSAEPPSGDLVSRAAVEKMIRTYPKQFRVKGLLEALASLPSAQVSREPSAWIPCEFSDDALAHAVRTPSQYDESFRAVAAELLALRQICSATRELSARERLLAMALEWIANHAHDRDDDSFPLRHNRLGNCCRIAFEALNRPERVEASMATLDAAGKASP